MKNKPIVVNMFAGPGAGKSTCSAAVFSLLKMHDVNAELITEFAKDLTWEKRLRTLDNQYYIWGKQHHKMWRVKDQVEVMITDSPLILGLIYGGPRPDCFNETIIESFKNEFDNINYFLIRLKKFNPKGRNQTEEESLNLDKEILHMLIDNDVKYEIMPGSYEGINNITKQILKRLGKEMKIYLKDGWELINGD